MQDQEAVQWTQEQPFVLKCSDHAHCTAEALFEVRHLYVVGISHFPGPACEPLTPPFADAQHVASVEDLEDNPTDRVSSGCFLLRERCADE